VAILGSPDNGTSRYNGSVWTLFFGGDGSDSAFVGEPDTDWAMSAQNLESGGRGRRRDGPRGLRDRRGREPPSSRGWQSAVGRHRLHRRDHNLWRARTSSVRRPWLLVNGGDGQRDPALAFAPSDTSCATYAFGPAANSADQRRRGTWTDLDPADQVPNRFVTGLAFRPGDANALYVTLSGSTARLETGPSFGAPTRCLRRVVVNVTPPVNIPTTDAVDPASPSVSYVGTDIGLWSTRTGRLLDARGPADGCRTSRSSTW
jgi:hypothetical protein